jgi:hypothetical protein
MGHIRLGALPRTRKWAEVVALIAGGAGAGQVANAAIRAAERDLAAAGGDHGLVEAVWLLSQLPLAARSEDFSEALRHCGLTVSDSPGLMEVVGAFADALDSCLAKGGGRTDLGEMAQTAAAETIAGEIGSRTHSLFGVSPDDVRAAFRELATVKHFSAFARRFFARLATKVLDYFLSRVLGGHTGEGRRFNTLAQQDAFTRALETHCWEASVIVETYAGEWLSKTRWEKGDISRADAATFAAYAVKKLVAELKEGARPDAD